MVGLADDLVWNTKDMSSILLLEILGPRDS